MQVFVPPPWPPPNVPDGWIMRWDTKHEQYFYVNLVNMNSQWQRPTEPAVSTPEEGNSLPNLSSSMSPVTYNYNRPDSHGATQGYYGELGTAPPNLSSPMHMLGSPEVHQHPSVSHSSSQQDPILYQNSLVQQQYSELPQLNAHYPQQVPYEGGGYHAQPVMLPQHSQPGVGSPEVAGGPAFGLPSGVLPDGQGIYNQGYDTGAVYGGGTYNAGTVDGGGAFVDHSSYPGLTNH